MTESNFLLTSPFSWSLNGRIQKVNSHAVGMAASRSYGFEIDFVRNPISGSTARLIVITLKFIFRPIYDIKISGKNFLT